MSRWAPLRQLIWARLREFTREPASIFWVYGFPLIMIVTLGMAFQGQPIEKIRVAIERGSLDDVIADHAPSASSEPRSNCSPDPRT